MSRGYSFGEVCRALEIKPHVLRYWEREIDLISPARDHGGRRLYSDSDLQLLFRVRYLVQVRDYSVRAAGAKLIQDANGERANVKARIHEVRGELLSLLGRVRSEKNEESADSRGNDSDDET